MEDFLDNLWTILIILLAIYYLSKFFFGDKNKICAWCKSKKIKKTKGNHSGYFWKFRNKDGTKDKRVRGNFQVAGYYSEYVCSKCKATTCFNHLVDKNPSAHVKVWKRNLYSNGEGKRKGSDWISNNVKTINKNLENRLGKDIN